MTSWGWGGSVTRKAYKDLVEVVQASPVFGSFPWVKQWLAFYESWEERQEMDRFSRFIATDGRRSYWRSSLLSNETPQVARARRLCQNYPYMGYSSFPAALISEGLVSEEWLEHPSYEEEWDIEDMVVVEDLGNVPCEYEVPRNQRVVVSHDGQMIPVTYSACVVHADDTFECQDCGESFHDDDQSHDAEYGCRCTRCQESYTRCNECDCEISEDYSMYSENQGTVCEGCYREEESGDHLHFHNSSSPGSSNVDDWVEEFYNRFSGTRGTVPELRIGPEIEVSECDDSPDDMCRTASAGWSGKEDGTSGVIAEFVPHHRLIGERGLARLMKFHDLLKDCGAYSDSTCGGHIHLDLSGCDDLEQRRAVEVRFSKRWAMFESLFYDEVFSSERQSSSFARPLFPDAVSICNLLEENQMPEAYGRYHALNMTGRTIEVRAAHSMLGDSAVAWAYLMMRMMCDTEAEFPCDDRDMVANDMINWITSEIPDSITEELGIEPDRLEDYAERTLELTATV